MKLSKTIHVITSIATALLFLFVAFPSQAAKIKKGDSQMKMGTAIKDSARLRWNSGRIQAATGRFILEGAQNGNISQEALGSGIAAAAHLDLAFRKNQERLGSTILQNGQTIKKKQVPTEGAHLQELLGSFIASSAVINQESKMAKQAAIGQKIQNQAQITWVMGMMSKAAYANLEGDRSQKISGSLISLLRRSRAFKQERNFRLAMTLLENETGRPMTQIFEGSSRAGSASKAQFTSAGLGGFAEYGLFSIAAFLYVGWVFSKFVTHLGFPQEKVEEAPYQFPEAA